MISGITKQKQLNIMLLQQIYVRVQITKEMERMNHLAPIAITE